MTQTIEQLTARVRELEEENARLIGRPIPLSTWQKMEQQLAASQLHAEQLREALQTFIDEHEECTDADDWMAMLCSIEAHHVAEEALALPHDTGALDAYVAEKVKEIIESHAPKGRNVTNAQHVEMRHKFVEQIATLTRQRDLAVDALTKCSEQLTRLGYSANHADKALSAIKESEQP